MSDWTHVFDFTQKDHDFYSHAGRGDWQLEGWGTDVSNVFKALIQLNSPEFCSTYIENITIHISQAMTGSTKSMQIWDGEIGTGTQTDATVGSSLSHTFTINDTLTQFAIGAADDNQSSAPQWGGYIVRCEVTGTGDNPFEVWTREFDFTQGKGGWKPLIAPPPYSPGERALYVSDQGWKTKVHPESIQIEYDFGTELAITEIEIHISDVLPAEQLFEARMPTGQSYGEFDYTKTVTGISGLSYTFSLCASSTGVYVSVQDGDSSSQDINGYITKVILKGIGSTPTADFEVYDGSTDLGKRFESTSKDDSGGTDLLTKYEWDFNGDGEFVAVANSIHTHTYNHSGLYLVTLRVTQDGVQTAEITKLVWAYDSSVPAFASTQDPTCADNSCIVYTTQACDGNPIGLADGEKIESVIDLSVNTPVGALDFTRTFRQSQLANLNDLGMGWTHNHIASIDDSVTDKLTVQIPGGGFAKFSRVGSTDIFKGDPGSTSEIDTSGSGLTSYVLTAQDKTLWEFDDSERLRKRIRPNSETWTYSYYTSGSAINLLESVGDGYGRELQFTYIDDSGAFNHNQLWRVGDQDATGLDGVTPAGRYVEFTYIEKKLDGSVVTPTGALLSEVQDVLGETWAYDYYGQVIGEDDADLANYLLRVVSPLVDTDGDGTDDATITINDQTYTIVNSEITQIVQKRGQVGSGAFLEEGTFAFQPNGDPITTITKAGKTVTHKFLNGVYAGLQDAQGNGSQQLQNTYYRPSKQYDANGNETVLDWNEGKTLTSVTDADGNITDFDYLTDGTDRLNYSLDAIDRKTEYTYGDINIPRQPTIIRVLEGATLLRRQEFVYDSKGRTTSDKEIDPVDETTVLRHVEREYYTVTGDGEGLLKWVRIHNMDDSTYEETSYTYDSVGQVIQVNKNSTFGNCLISRTVYDMAGSVVASICNYDNGAYAHPTTAQEAADLYDLVADPDKNQVTTHTYDAMGRRVTTTSNAGNTTLEKTTQIVYDALSRVTRQIGNFVDNSYAAPGNWVFESGIWKDGTGGTTISHGTDLNENIISRTEYNDRGLVRLTQDHLGNVVLYGYDDADRLVKTVQSANTPGYNNNYSGTLPDPDLNDYVEVTTSTDIDIITKQFYDAVGNLVKTIDSAGRVNYTVYDALNRPVKVVQNAKDIATIDLSVGEVGYDGKLDPRSSSYIISTDSDRDQISETEHDALGRVIRTKRLLDIVYATQLWDVTLIGYDTLGRQVKTIAHALDDDYAISGDPDLSLYTISNDPDVDIITETFYNAQGQVDYTKDSEGRETHFAYDGLQRQMLTVGNFIDATPTPYQVIENWEWSGSKWQDGATPTPIDIEFGTGNDENIISKTTYDADGYVTFTRDVDGRETRFVYDALGRQVRTILNYVVQGTSVPQDWTWNGSNWEDGATPTPNNIDHGTNNDQNIISETVFDDQGRVESTRDSQGNVTFFVYDSANRRVRTIQNYVSNGEDPSLWAWDDVNDLWEKSDGITAIVHGANDDQNLISITEYDVAGRVESTTDTRHNQTYAVYDNLGRRIRTIQNYVSNGEDPSLWIWDATAGQWEKSDDTTAISHGTNNDENVISDTTYTKDARVVSTRSRDGNETQQVYDDAGRRIRTVQNYVIQGVSDPADWVWDATDNQWEDGATNAIVHGATFDQNLITDTIYNKSGQVISTRDARGTQTTFIYDNSGRRVSVTQAANTGVAMTSYTCFDKQGRVLRAISNWMDDGTDPDERDGSGVWAFIPTSHGRNNDANIITEYEYDSASRRVKVINANGDNSQTTYFKDGTVDTVTDPEGTITAYRYDSLRRRTRVIQSYVSNTEDPALWKWTSTQWTKNDGTTAIAHGTNNDQNIIVDVNYDTLGRMTQMLDPRHNLTTYEYDQLGRRTKLTNPLSKEWATTYANIGNITQTTMNYPGINGGASYDVVRDFDRLGRLTEIDYADLTNTPTVQFAYDSDGNRQTMTEIGTSSATIRETTYGYDELGRLTSVGFNTDGTGAIEETVSYEYDISGNRTTLTLPNTDEINYAYDDRGRLVSMTDWDNQTSTFRYDKLGRHVGTQRSNGFTSKYAYNKAGHLQELRHGEGWDTVKTLQSFVYTTNSLGNRTQVKEVSLRDTASSSVTMAHDDESIVYSGDWDANGSFHETTETNVKLAVMFYGNTGINLTMGTGDDCGIYDVYINQTLWQSYDGYASVAGEDVIALEVKGDGAHLLEVYQRREKNSASSDYKVRFKQLVALEAYDVGTIDYTYDDLSRLKSANYDGGAVEYTYGYDLAGNLVDNNGVTNTFNDANQLTGDGTDTFDYDNNGNLWKTNSVVSHTWDRANRLLSHGTHSYAYDGNSARIQKTVSSVVTDYLLDVQRGLTQVLRESDGTNTNHYIHSPRGIHAMNDGTNWSYMLQDGLGSVRAEIAQNVAVNGSQSYAPYGEVFGASGSMSSPFAFTGEPLDGNGLQYHRARYYDPAMGVWANQDFLETPNRYGYVSGNVVNRVDPTGLFDWESWSGSSVGTVTHLSGQIEQGDWLYCIAREGTPGWTVQNGRFVSPPFSAVQNTLWRILNANADHPNAGEMFANVRDSENNFIYADWEPIQIPLDIALNGIENRHKSCPPVRTPNIPQDRPREILEIFDGCPKKTETYTPPTPPPDLPYKICSKGKQWDDKFKSCVPVLSNDCDKFWHLFNAQVYQYRTTPEFLYNNPSLWNEIVSNLHRSCLELYLDEYLEIGPCLRDPDTFTSISADLATLLPTSDATNAAITGVIVGANIHGILNDIGAGQVRTFEDLLNNPNVQSTALALGGTIKKASIGKVATAVSIIRTLNTACGLKWKN